MSNNLTESTNITLNIKTVFSLLLKKAVIIILCTVLCGLGTLFYYGVFVSPQYTATVSIIVDNRTIGNPGSESLSLKSTSDISASRLLTDTYIAIFSTSSFLESVSNNVNETSPIISEGRYEPMNSTSLSGSIKMSAVNNTEILEIKVSTSSPQLCVDICYAIMEEAKVVLAETLDQSEVKSVEGDNILVPTEPSSPGAFSRAILGAIIGGFVSCFVIITLFVFRNQNGTCESGSTTPKKQVQAKHPAPVYSAPQSNSSAEARVQVGYNEPVYSDAQQGYEENAYSNEQVMNPAVTAHFTPNPDAAPKMRPRPRPQRQAPTAPKQQ